MDEDKRTRILVNAPCEYQEWRDSAKKWETRYQQVNCNPGNDCARCGWNPAVKEARLKKAGSR